MSERVKPIEKRPTVGRPLVTRFGTQVMVGPKSYYPNSTIVDGQDGWRIFPDWDRQCVWVGWGTPLRWSAVPMGNVQYLGYELPEEPTEKAKP